MRSHPRATHSSSAKPLPSFASLEVAHVTWHKLAQRFGQTGWVPPHFPQTTCINNPKSLNMGRARDDKVAQKGYKLHPNMSQGLY
eukprot:6253291-Amphidinium_carterae.1